MRRVSSLFALQARHRFVVAVAGTMVVLGCSTGGMSSGCSGLEPLPGGRYTGPKNDNALNIRISPNGINYLNSHWQDLIGALLPNQTLSFPVACQKVQAPAIGDVYVADQGNASGSGKFDGQCDSRDLPANVQIQIIGFSLTPTSPDKVAASVTVSIDTGKIYATNPHSLCDLKCSLQFQTSRNGAADNKVTANLQFEIDTKWDKLLAFKISSLDGTKICGSLGAPGGNECLDPDDIDLSRESGFCSYVCDAADWAPIKDFVLRLVSPFLQTQIQTVLDQQSCEPCGGADMPQCPQFPNAASTCSSDGICVDSADASHCVPKFLGVEGRLKLGGLLSQFGAPAEAALDVSIAAGSTATVDQGISLGTRAGLQNVTPSPCVPMQAAPPMIAVSAPNFDGEAPAPDPVNGQYFAAFSISSPFLNLAFHQAHQGGAMCLQLGSDTISLVNTSVFKTFLPSLGKITSRDGKDAPMLIALRPAKAPSIVVGLGTYDPATKKPLEPLLTITMPELSMDFYAMIDDRYVRLFTLTADISMPMSLIFEGCDKVTPALGDLKMLVTNVHTANSEMLAEDPKVLEDLIPAVIGLAEPAIAGGLKPVKLPAAGPFKLKVSSAKGLAKIAGTAAYNHLGVFAYLLPLNAACAVSAPRTTVSVKRTIIPKAEEMRLAGHALPIPQVVLDVAALGKAGSPEFSYRVDNGLWLDFVDAPAGELVVSHPRFLLQGTHTIDVRSRVSEDSHGISSASSVTFVIDWDPPELSFEADRASDLLVLRAHDVISGDALEYSYAVGSAPFSDFGPSRDISLSAVEAQGGVAVQVRDAQHNVAALSWKPPKVALRPDVAPEPALDAPHTGCSATAGVDVLALGLVLALARRRRA